LVDLNWSFRLHTQPTAITTGPHAFTSYSLLLAAIASLSGLLFGFDTAIVNGGLVLLRHQFRLTNLQTEAAASALLVGAVIGAACAGTLGDRFGRRRMLFIASLFFGVSSIGAALPANLLQFEIARLIGGIAIGVASSLAPLYIAETAPRQYRGFLVTLNQLAIVLGILISFFVSWRLSVLGEGAWRWMFGVGVVPALALLLGLFFIPESPRWLASHGQESKALAILARTLGMHRGEVEMNTILAELNSERRVHISLASRALRKPLLIAITLAVLQQVTGINTVLYYGAILFSEHVGSNPVFAIGANVLIGFVNLLGTILSMMVMDKFGRKPLLVTSSIGMGVCLLMLAGSFHLSHPPTVLILTTLLLYVMCFASGMGPVVWVYIAEIFPAEVRARAVSVATVALWSGCCLVTLTFLTLIQRLGTACTFLIYALLSLATACFAVCCMPETKGRSLEEIATSWHE